MASLRPSEYTEAELARQGITSNASLVLQPSGDESVDVIFVDPVTEYLLPRKPDKPPPPRKVRILNFTRDYVTIWPINVRQDKPDYLQPKYGRLTRIILPRARTDFAEFGSTGLDSSELPKTEDDVTEYLNELPEGFGKKFRFGLGFNHENRWIPNAIAQIPGVTTLRLDGSVKGNGAIINAPDFLLSLARYQDIRKSLRQIADRYQRAGREDKGLIAYEHLLNAADDEMYPPRPKRLRKDAIFELISVGGAKPALSPKDQNAALRLVNQNTKALAENEPQALLALRADIERVTLAQLITTIGEMLEKELPETKWQSFFQANPFVLSLAFAVPAMLIENNPYVGGMRFNGGGGKIGDFLMATASTGNLAIVEIKRPQTPVTGSQYRDDVHGPSKELGGSIAQVLDQRLQLQQSFLHLRESSGLLHLQAHAIVCVVIIGRSPSNSKETKSFELIRNSLKDVFVITFDELLGRLKEIYKVLSDAA